MSESYRWISPNKNNKNEKISNNEIYHSRSVSPIISPKKSNYCILIYLRLWWLFIWNEKW